MRTLPHFFAQRARFLRKVSRSTDIEKTLRKAVAVLACFEIPHYVCGGFAVQEHGYARFTEDVDIIVPDVQYTCDKLSMNGFKMNLRSSMTVTDRKTGVSINVLPGGGKVCPGPVSFPMPTRVSDEPQILTLSELISLKLSGYLGDPVGRIQDYADASKLIEVNSPECGLAVEAEVQDLYQKLWVQIYETFKA